MPDQRAIYRDHADRYDELVRAEDWRGNLIAALSGLARLPGARVVEAGAGTGRATRLLLEAGAAEVVATDAEAAMLAVAQTALQQYGGRARFEVADARVLPSASGEADLSIAAWVFGHLRHWMPDDWRRSIGDALDELDRVVRPGGHVVVIETLGTGAEQPAPPNPALAEYFAWLESDRGFTRKAIRTDYRFASVEDAARITGFFFGTEFEARVRTNGRTIVPECTGIWWRKKGGARRAPA